MDVVVKPGDGHGDGTTVPLSAIVTTLDRYVPISAIM